ncbi:MAG: cell envelope integrity protein CreD [Pseudomonadota bacterium]
MTDATLPPGSPVSGTASDPAPTSERGPRPKYFQGPGWRFAVLCALTFLMGIPLLAIAMVIEDRVAYKREAVREVSRQWGGPVALKGPALIIPVEVTRDGTVRGPEVFSRTETITERADPIILMPEVLEITAAATSEVRRRGIFDVPVYGVGLDLVFRFDTERVAQVLRDRETALWDLAELRVGMPSTRAFVGDAALTAGEARFDLEPGASAGLGGIKAALGDPRSLGDLRLEMALNGTDELTFSPAGRVTRVTITSDWPDPAFSGAFLPTSRTIQDDGFQARWEISHLARDIPQVARGADFRSPAFGVRFFNAVDIYHRAQRAAKYGTLFIALTFLTVFLSERLASRPAHPVQVVLIGIAQCVFFLLLLSLSEQIGFGLSYILAALATTALIGFYGATGLGLGRWWWTLAGALAVLYGVLYLILQSADYALLAGSILAFVAVALMMVMRRSDDWTAPRGAAA